MIRLVQRRLIIPRGDTGTFSVPVLSSYNSGDAAVFSIIDPRTHRRVYNQLMYVTDNVLSVKFEYGDTVNLPVGKFLWDIKFYQDPVIEDNQVVSGKEVDSYYAAFTMPECEIRQTGDNMLTADDAPGSTLTPQHINAINAALFALNEAVEKTETNVTHYPTIIDGEWNVWDANLGNYTTTGIEATGNGIASIEKTNTVGLVDTYTVNFTDGTTFLYNITNGSSISSITKQSTSGLEDTYVIIYTDGNSTTFTVTNGATPNISIGTVQEGPIAAASITGTAANPVLNLTLPNANVPTRVSELENDSNYAVDANYVHTDNNYTTAEKNKLSGIAAGAEVNVNADWNAISGDAQILNKPTNVSAFTNDAGYLTEHQDLSDYVQKTDYATNNVGGVVKVAGEAYGVFINDNGLLYTAKATDSQIAGGTNNYKPIVPNTQHISTFYGLAKVAGDISQLQSSNAVGTYTNEAKAAIQTMLDVPSNADVAAKQDILTFDNAPTANSTNPVTSGGVYNAIANVNTMKIHICTQGEYNSETGVPTIQNPDTQTFYLVPGGEGSNLFIEWVYVNNNWERFGSADVEVPVQDVQVNGTSILDAQGVANVPVASANASGVVQVTGSNSGIGLIQKFINGQLITTPKIAIISASNAQIKNSNGSFNPITPDKNDRAVFYGLAKTAGDSTQSASENAVGTYTDEAKAAIQQMLDVPSTSDIPEVPVQDVQVNGTSILNNGVANIPYANDNNSGGIVRANSNFGITYAGAGLLSISCADTPLVKSGSNAFQPITPYFQHESTFYGLAKAAGADMKDITNTTVGTYPDAQKEAIQSMLGISQMLAPTNSNLIASQAYAVGDVFVANGKLYKATTAIAQDGAIIPDTNCVETTMAEVGGKIKDVQVGGTSIVVNGIANIPPTGASRNGYVRIDSAYGINANEYGRLYIQRADDSTVKAGTNQYRPIVPYNQHESIFYGLSKLAGVDLANEIVTLGTYPEISKTAIRSMLGATSNNVIAVQDTQPTDPDTKIWLPETAGTAVQVPTVSEMNAALSGKVGDVQVNSVSVVTNGVANVPVASSSTLGAIRTAAGNGILVTGAGIVYIAKATDAHVKSGSSSFLPIVTDNQHVSAFYGLAKVAGHDEASSTEPVGTYTPEAKGAIQSMLGVSDLIATAENSLVASRAYAIGDVFTANGKLYKATAAIAVNDTIVLQNSGETISGSNAEEIKLSDYAVHDVQLNGSSVMQGGVANVPVSTSSTLGVMKVSSGLNISSAGSLYVDKSPSSYIKSGENQYRPIVPYNQHESAFYGFAKAAGDTTQSQSNNAVGTYTNEAKAAIKSMIGVNVDDVQIDGTSILSNGVANIPITSTSTFGVVKIGDGLYKKTSNNAIAVNTASVAHCKAGTSVVSFAPVSNHHAATFYGLAKAAGDTTQSASSNEVGQYTDNAKASIKSMLGIVDGSTGTVSISGTTPAITAVENTRYVCDEVSTLSFTPPANGISIVRFTSGTTAAVLTLPSTVKFPEWFDATSLEADTIYEICITDGIYGAVMSWAL